MEVPVKHGRTQRSVGASAIHALTIDVEEHFQVAALSQALERSQWDVQESRVERNTGKILDLLEQESIKATFFILGWVAERHPSLVRRIDERGHEVACHGYSHRQIFTQTAAEFREETRRAKQVLEENIQKPVCGYRAASFSITKESFWALDILAEEGFLYDSSIVPTRHDLYGLPEADPVPHILTTEHGHQLVEYPPTTLAIFGYRLPVGGGGYFRLFPYWFTKWALGRAACENGVPFIFYLHPWEVDPSQPRIAGVGLLSRFRHYNNLRKCETRLCRLLSDFRFGRCTDVLEILSLLPATTRRPAPEDRIDTLTTTLWDGGE